MAENLIIDCPDQSVGIMPEGWQPNIQFIINKNNIKEVARLTNNHTLGIGTTKPKYAVDIFDEKENRVCFADYDSHNELVWTIIDANATLKAIQEFLEILIKQNL